MFKNLEAEQARHRMSNAQMAEYLGMNRGTYESKKKTGKFQLSEIVKLLELFNSEFNYLFETELDKKDGITIPGAELYMENHGAGMQWDRR